MDFLNKLFGKKQPEASGTGESPSPTQTIPPVAAQLHNVVTAMCTDPGRSFSQDAHAAPLYTLLPDSAIPKNVASLFVDVTTLTAAFSGAHTTESMNALNELCTIQGAVVSNLLHCIASMRDTTQTVAVMDFSGRGASGDRATKVSFESQRRMARAELSKRGSPKYDTRHYAGS